jgi:hypothetical protein
LHHGKDECEVTLNPFLFQNLRRAYTFPRGGELDQNTLRRHAQGIVHANDTASAGDRSLRVKGEPRVHLGRNVARDNIRDGLAQVDGQAINGERYRLVVTPWLFLSRVGDGIVHHLRVDGVPAEAGLGDKERIGRGIRNVSRVGVFTNDCEVATVDTQGCHGRQLGELRLGRDGHSQRRRRPSVTSSDGKGGRRSREKEGKKKGKLVHVAGIYEQQGLASLGNGGGGGASSCVFVPVAGVIVARIFIFRPDRVV